MPSTSTIHPLIPTTEPVIWAASRLKIERGQEAGITVTRQRLKTPNTIWTLHLNASGECNAIVLADWYLLLKTGAWSNDGPHEHGLHHISSDGRVLWSLPWQTTDQVGLLGDRFVVVRYLSTPHDPVAQPPLTAHMIDPRSGRALMSHAIPIPAPLLPLYEEASGNELAAALEHEGQQFAVRVGLGRQGAEFVYALPFGRQGKRRMGFVCPECLTPGALQIRSTIALPGDSRSDDIALQIVACERCNLRAVAVYEESRRGDLKAEAWEHVGFRVPAAVVDGLEATMARCPRPDDPGCSCVAHEALGRRDSAGRWQRPDGAGWQGMFAMRLVRGES